MPDCNVRSAGSAGCYRRRRRSPAAADGYLPQV